MSHPVNNLLDKAYTARRENQYSEAQNLLKEAMSQAEDENDNKLLIKCLKFEGQLFRDTGEFDEALKAYDKALVLQEQTGDQLQIAHTLRHIGDILILLNEIVNANNTYERVLRIYEENPNRNHLELANTARGFAILNEKLENIEIAKQQWMKARELYNKTGVKEGVDECNHRLELLA